MSVVSHLEELKRKHEQLSQQIELDERSPGADNTEISYLKRQKLRLKEEIARLSRAS